MGILKDQLPQSKLGLKGNTPATRAGAQKTSTMHYQSSINNNPAIPQQPSSLDFDGAQPNIPGKVPYMNNLPE